MSRVLTIDLLRHGLTEQGDGYTGQLDVALTGPGLEQMQRSVDGINYDHITSSPLRRCALFAQQFGQQTGCPVDIDERLMEMHFGEWQGLDMDRLQAEFPGALEDFWHDPLSCTPPGGETLADFNRRLEAARGNLEECASAGHHLVVSHGGAIRVLLCQWLELPLQHLLRLHIPHGGLSRIQLLIDGDTLYPELRFLNGPAQ